MFSKPDSSPETGRKMLAASLIAQNVTLTGDLVSDGEVQLDGVIVGDIRVARLTIGESGRVEGSIEADAVDVRGAVLGAIKARAVKLFATARVDGDITQSTLAMEAGAHFQGRSISADAAAPQLSVAAE
jgi:cytoskeletal protein CcmA (bactofilin family)